MLWGVLVPLSVYGQTTTSASSSTVSTQTGSTQSTAGTVETEVRDGVVYTKGGKVRLTELPTGQLGVTSCKPPGSPTWGGKDGLPCVVLGLSDGLYVKGVCKAGECRAVSFTSANNALEGFLKNAGKSFVSSLTQSFLGNMFGGGGYGNYDTPYTSDNETESGSDLAIEFSSYSDTGTTRDDYQFTYDYDSEDASYTYEYDSAFDDDNTVIDTDTGTTRDESDSDASTTDETKGNSSSGSTDTTTPHVIERIYGVSGGHSTQSDTRATVHSIPGTTQFERDLNGLTLFTDTDTNTSEHHTLSLNDLERSAYESRLREARLQTARDDTTGLRDYESSSLYQRRTTSNQYDITEQQTERPWWFGVVSFLGSLFGL